SRPRRRGRRFCRTPRTTRPPKQFSAEPFSRSANTRTRPGTSSRISPTSATRSSRRPRPRSPRWATGRCQSCSRAWLRRTWTCGLPLSAPRRPPPRTPSCPRTLGSGRPARTTPGPRPWPSGKNGTTTRRRPRRRRGPRRRRSSVWCSGRRQTSGLARTEDSRLPLHRCTSNGLHCAPLSPALQRIFRQLRRNSLRHRLLLHCIAPPQLNFEARMRLILFSLFFAAGPVVAAELRVGAAAVVITPPEGTPLAGYYSERGSKKVLDDIYAKAIVLEVGETKAALVVCDLISLPRHVVTEARRQIEATTKIPGAHVMLSATHTHTGPVLTRESALDELVGATSDLGRRYTEKLPELIAKSVAEADKKLAPARASVARGKEEGLSFNRRFLMKDAPV